MNWRYCDILCKVTMMRHLTLFLLILFVKTRITVELTWNTEKVSYDCCQSKSQLLIWNFTEAENERVMELQWFFNETTLICLDSKTIGFHVETLYVGRVERNAKAGILLHNVSLNDAGKYTLYVKLADEKIRNVQHISLAVDEQVPDQCEPIIEFYSQNVMRCFTTCTTKSHLSPKWIINGTRDTVGIGPYLITNEEISEQASCCLLDLKCHDDDRFKSCKPNPIPSNIFKGGNRTMRNDDRSTVKAAKDDSNNTNNILAITLAVCFLIALIVVLFMWRRHKSLDVDPKKSDTAKECTDCLDKADNLVGTADRYLHQSNSNQNIQIVNNISLDGDFVTSTVNSQRMSMTYLEDVREENIELKRQLPSYKHSKRLHARQADNSTEMTEVKCRHPSHNDTDDTDKSEASSYYEDAVSEQLVWHNWSDNIRSFLPSGCASSY